MKHILYTTYISSRLTYVIVFRMYLCVCMYIYMLDGLPWLPSGKESACWCRRPGFILGLEDALRRKWQPTPVFLPGKSHGQRSPADYSPWNHKRVRHDWVTKQQYFRYTIYPNIYYTILCHIIYYSLSLVWNCITHVKYLIYLCCIYALHDIFYIFLLYWYIQVYVSFELSYMNLEKELMPYPSLMSCTLLTWFRLIRSYSLGAIFQGK